MSPIRHDVPLIPAATPAFPKSTAGPLITNMVTMRASCVLFAETFQRVTPDPAACTPPDTLIEVSSNYLRELRSNYSATRESRPLGV
jgi:hypothetical protein